MQRPDRVAHVWLYIAAVLYGLTFWYWPAHDPDLGWHLTGGAWIVQHHAVPLRDFINSFNQSWHDYHWLAQVLLFKLYVLGGSEVLRVALGLLMASLCVILVDIILLTSPRPPVPTVVLTAFFGAITLIGHVTSIRPQMVALVLFALAVRRLIQPPAVWELPYLFALTVLLVNIHVYWAFIPFIWLLYRCVPRFLGREKVSAATAWGGLALLAGAGLVSPYGAIPTTFTPPFLFMNYALLWDYATMPAELKATIGEFRGALSTEGFTPWLIVLYLMQLVRTFRGRRFLAHFGEGMSAVVFALLAINSLKFVSIFAVGALPYFVREVTAWVRPRLRPVARWEQHLATAVVVIAIIGSAAHAAWHFPWTSNNDEYLYAMQPIAACRHVATLGLTPRAPRDHIRVLTHFNHGGWCRWVLYQERPDLDFRVTTDGRTQWVPAQHFLDAYDVLNVKNDWLATLTRWDPDVLVIPKTHALGNVLALDQARFTMTFEDDNFRVFVPRR